MKNVLILLFLILLTAGGAFSQATQYGNGGDRTNMPKIGVIKGKIIDADTKTPMEYANIAIYSKRDSKLVTGGITNAAGGFEITELPYGMYYVEAKFIGFEKNTIKDIKIFPNSTTVDMGTIELAVSTQKLGTVDVVADRNRIEYKIDKKVINVAQDVNAAGGTAVTVLENTPSVEVDIDGNVTLRGSSSFTVLIDGRPSVLTGSDALKQIPSSVIENIEIITNPSVKYDPDGQAGIINIVMKKNLISGFNGIINVKAGSRNQFGTDLTMNYKTKKYNLFFGANWDEHTDYGTMKSSREIFGANSTSFLDSDGKRDQTRGGKQLKLGFDYFLTKNTSVTLSGQVGKYNFDGLGDGTITKYTLPTTIDSFLISDNNSSRNGDTKSADASFLSKLNGDGTHKLEGTFTYRRRTGKSNDNTNEFLSDPNYIIKFDTISQVATNEDSQSDDYRMKIDYTLPFGAGNKLEAGIQSRMERETEDFKFTNFGVNNPDFTSGMKYKEDIHSAYSTFSGNLSSIQYMLGLRGEYNLRSIEDSKNPTPYKLNKFDLFPSAHLSYELPNKDQLMVSYSRRVNRPDGRDLDPFPSYMNRYTIRTGNPDLKPEYSDSYELSYINNFGKSFISFETFYRSTKELMYRSNFTDTITKISYMTVKNLNSDFSLGGEIMANIEANKWLLINTSFSLYNYQMKGEDMGKSVDKQSTNYSGRLNTTFKFNANSRLQLTANYRGPSTSVQGDQKGMMFTNVSYRQDFMKKKLTATVVMRDVLGTARFEGTSYGNGSKSTFRMQRDPRVVTLTLSYKINNYKMEKPNAPTDQPTQGAEDMF